MPTSQSQPRKWPAAHVQYDERTGQVYTETSVAVTSMVSTWMKKFTGRKDDPSRYRRRNWIAGASSLHDMALRSCVWNIDLFEPEVLACAGWAYAERIYRDLRSRDALTIKNWAVFHKAFPESEDLDRAFSLQIGAEPDNSPRELDPIRKQLASLPSMSLTNLNLHNLALRDTDLMNLLDLPNLSVLVLEQCRALSLSQGDGGISDQFMRRWGRAVSDAKAFTKLRVVVFRHFQTSLADSFACFTVFPALLLCNVDSSLAGLNTKELTHGGPVPPQGRLRYLPIEGPNAQGRGKNPESTWKRSDKTTHEKMAMLYELAGTLVPQPDANSTKDTVVSIRYGDASHYRDPKSYSAWYVRVPAAAIEHATIPVKRPNLEGGDAAELSNPRKKKSVKRGKKQDIGALLGAFA